MTGSLRSLDAVLAEVLDGLAPVVAASVALDAAVGQRLANDLRAAAAVPPKMIALHAGLAVNALDLVGASLHAPVTVPEMPVMVAVGEAMPAGCNAVLDPAAVAMVGPLPEVTDGVAPGTWVRRAGHDLAAGATIATAGTVLTPEMALAAKLSGVSRAVVQRLDIGIQWPAGAERDWLEHRLGLLRIGGSSEATAGMRLILRPAPDDNHRVALMAGAAVSIDQRDGIVTVAMPRRFDGVVGAWCAVVLPIIAHLHGAALPTRTWRLTRKIASAVGMAEVVLLKTTGEDAEPLAVGDLTLAAIAAADAFAVIPADAEGHAAGSALTGTPFAGALLYPIAEPR